MALICAALMLATITLSAFMRLSQAGLGCDPWPGCYGQSARAAAQGLAVSTPAGHGVAVARLAHRVVASLVLILSITMVLSTWLTKPVLRREGLLAAAVLALALGLAVLGIVTPGARVPAVALGNLLGGFLMLALCWRLAAPAERPGLGAWALAAALVVSAQIALGALVSGSLAALSCSSLADCRALAQASGWPWKALNPWQVPLLEATARVNPAGALVQWLHRAGALLVLPLLALLGLRAWRRGRARAGVALGLLAALQAALGLLASTAGQPIALVLLHNLLAALSLAVLVRLA
jgi:cytochrome c oxidase assembly protein subunit 15